MSETTSAWCTWRSIMATVDRLMHHAHVVVTEGSSLRLAEAMAGKGVVPIS